MAVFVAIWPLDLASIDPMRMHACFHGHGCSDNLAARSAVHGCSDNLAALASAQVVALATSANKRFS